MSREPLARGALVAALALVGCATPSGSLPPPAAPRALAEPVASEPDDEPATEQAAEPEIPDDEPTAPKKTEPPKGSLAAPPPAGSPKTPSDAAPKAAAPSADLWLSRAFERGGKTLRAVLKDRERYRFQVLYAAVTKAEAGRPASLERHGYFADAEYFFPASSMKVPLALASYDRLPALRHAKHAAVGLGRDTTLEIFPSSGPGSPFSTTLARETWRALIVSDNASANRLLAFAGHKEAHETLWGLGLASARVRMGFATGGEIDPATVSPRIDLVPKTGPRDTLPPRKSTLVLPATRALRLEVGNASVESGKLVKGPASFADRNAMTLRDLQDTLVRIVRPELLGAKLPKDQATPDDLAYVKEALGTLPSQSGLPGYDRNVVADYRLNPFLRGLERVRARGRLEVYAKVGQAYGFLTTNAYVVEKATGKAFFLAATVYANPDEVINDDLYAYDDVAFPALADVAEVVAREALGE
ncbi:MAG: serine hydrolase [Myxococcales bacterium]|nr:serine hydrolase [Myxococcales bacterium]